MKKGKAGKKSRKGGAAGGGKKALGKEMPATGPTGNGGGKNKIFGLLTKPELFFLAKFFIIFSALEAGINYFGFKWLQGFIAASQAALLGLRSAGDLVFLHGGEIFEVSPSCTGLVSGGILFAIVFSLKKPQLWKKAAIFAAGALLLLVLNYFRVIAVLWTGKTYGAGAADIVHVASWFSTTIFVLALWYYFTKKITGAKDFSDFM